MTVDAANAATRPTAPGAGSPPAEPGLDAYRGDGGVLDADRLAGDLPARASGDPEAVRTLAAQFEAGMSPVERGQFEAALTAANDNGSTQIGANTPGAGRQVDGQPFRIGDPNAPRVADWGAQPQGTPYRDTWDHVAERLGTTDATAITADIERQLYGTMTTTAGQPLQPPSAGVAPSVGGGSSQEGIGSFLDGAVLGDFSDNDSWSHTAGQVAMGFVPIAGQIADARDTVAATGQVWRGEDGGWLNLGTSLIGWVPGIGDGIKGALRGGRHAVEAGTEVTERVVRNNADRVIEGTFRREGDQIGEGAVRREGDAATDASRAADALPVRRFDNADDFNRAANNAQPNSIYQYGNYSYTTDARGRVTAAEGRAQINPAGRNDPSLQTAIGHEGKSTDVGFHMIADVLGGQTNRLNVVPGNGRPLGDGVANLNTGQYAQFERTVRGIAADPAKNVEIRVEARYHEGNTTNRPDEFVASYRVDGGRWREQTMINK